VNLYIKKQTFWGQRLLIKTVALVFLLIALNIFSQQLKNSFHAVSSPLTKVFSHSGQNSSYFLASFINVKNLQQENNAIKEENQNLLYQLALLQEYFSQNTSLNAVLMATQGDNVQLVMADIVGINTAEDIVILDKGSADGIAENMPVISKDKVVYGKVIKVYENFSEILLPSAKQSVVDVKVQSFDQQATPVHGAVKGEGGFSVYLDLITSDSTINENDVLVTSALEGIFPQNLLVGKIASVDKNDLKPFQSARVEPFFNIYKEDSLFIITNYK